LANEAIVYASELQLPTVYTDHSLFGFNDVASIVLNRVLKTTLGTVSAAICVSQTCRQNLLQRATLDPSIVYTIPNAIDATKFTPNPTQQCHTRVKVVVVSRLVYRKGVDLLVGLIPLICAKFPNVDFIIGGDGSKKSYLERMLEREQLQDRVECLGALSHDQVPHVLARGHLFVNCSLTESFCIAILEAACSGLFVVSTNVGGVPEVLPDDMIYLAEPSVKSLVEQLSKAIDEQIVVTNDKKVVDTKWNGMEFHQRIQRLYSWHGVAEKTSHVYRVVVTQPKLTFLERLARHRTVGPIAGIVVSVLAVTLHFLVTLVEQWQPRECIDVVPNIPTIPTTTKDDETPTAFHNSTRQTQS